MGYNAVVLVSTDAQSSIEEDKDFGKELSVSIGRFSISKGKAVPVRASGKHAVWPSAAEVITCRHADEEYLVLVGGNTAEVLSWEESTYLLQELKRFRKRPPQKPRRS